MTWIKVPRHPLMQHALWEGYAMTVEICIVQGHPDPAEGHLSHALADAYADAAETAGHTCHRVAPASLEFGLLRSQAEFESGSPPPDIAQAQNSIEKAGHLLLIYPLWLGTMPARLKGFLEQVLRPGFAFDYTEGGVPRKRLKGRSARIIVTMGMPAPAYRWFYGAHSLRSLERNIMTFCGIGPVRHTLIGGAGTITEARFATLDRRVRRLGRNAR